MLSIGRQLVMWLRPKKNDVATLPKARDICLNGTHKNDFELRQGSRRLGQEIDIDPVGDAAKKARGFTGWQIIRPVRRRSKELVVDTMFNQHGFFGGEFVSEFSTCRNDKVGFRNQLRFERRHHRMVDTDKAEKSSPQ